MANYSDNFNRADGALGADWTTIEGSPVIVSGAVGSGGVEEEYLKSIARYAHDMDTANHAVQVIVTVPLPEEASLYLHLRATGSSYYEAWLDWGGYTISRFVTGEGNELAVGSTGYLATDDVVRFAISGSLLTLSLNGVEVVSVPDFGLTTGQGVDIGTFRPASSTDVVLLNSFSAEDVAAVTTHPYYYRNFVLRER